LRFWWKTSCEDDPTADNWDYLRLLVDDVEVLRVDGITAWTQVLVPVADGLHAIRWEYRKDESLSEGEDRAWVDQVVFLTGALVTVTTPVPVPFSWLDQFPLLLSLAGGDYELAASIDVDGDGHLTWQEYVTGSIPTDRDSVFRTLIAFSNGQSRVTWEPDLGTTRSYRVFGRTNLLYGAWGATTSGSRFFKAEARMP
jgi:hypothetical protein